MTHSATIEVPEDADLPLKPWERLVTGMDLGRDQDHSCLVCAIHDSLTGKLRIIDVEFTAATAATESPRPAPSP